MARVLEFRDHRIGCAMVQVPSSPKVSSADFNRHVDPCLIKSAAPIPAVLAPSASAGRPTAGPRMRVRTHALGRGVVLEVAGRLDGLGQDLDRAIQFALADAPRSVVCDLSSVIEGADPSAVQMLATAGRHVRDWPAIPVAVACPDPRVREGLRVHPLGGKLIVTESMLTAVSAVLATPIPAVTWLRLASHPTAPRAARDFVTRTLTEWDLGPLIPSACLVISELVTNSTVHARTDIELSLAWSLGMLRLTVRDHSAKLPRPRKTHLGLHGRGLTIVAGFSHAFGVLPTTEGGKVVWAVLDGPAAAPRPAHAVHSRSLPPPASHTYSSTPAAQPEHLLRPLQPAPNPSPLKALPHVRGSDVPTSDKKSCATRGTP